MAAKREVPNADDLIRAYVAGEPMRQRLKQAAISDCLFRRLLRDAGIKRRAPQDSYAMRRIRPKPGPKAVPANMADLLVRYAAGASEKALAAEAGVVRSTMRALLTMHGAKVRGRSEAELTKWRALKQDRAAVERQCGNAWQATRSRDDDLEWATMELYRRSMIGARVVAKALGTSRSNVNRLIRANGGVTSAPERRAHGMQYAGGGGMVSAHELPILGALYKLGLHPVHQLAVGPYNVDIAFEKERVAVEIERGPLRSSHSLARERIEYLFNRGWRLFVVLDGKCAGIDSEAVAKKIVADMQVLTSAPPGAGQYGVISRHGKTSTRTGNDLHGWPRIQGL